MRRGKPVQVKYETLLVVWLALLTSQVLFFFLAWYTRPALVKFDASEPFFAGMPLVTVVFAAIALVFLILSFVLSRQHMRRAVEDQDAGCVQTGLVLGCLLSEFPSLLGLVLAFGFNHPYFYFWIFLGTIGMLLHFPRKGNLDAATYKLRP